MSTVKTTTPKLVVIGVGNFARRYHFPTLDYLIKNKEVEIHGIFDINASKAKEVATAYLTAKVYSSIEEIGQDTQVNAIAVIVHPNAAYQVIKKVATFNKPIFCEKPPGGDSIEAKELAGLVKVPNVVAFNRRYSPMNQTFRDILSNRLMKKYVDIKTFGGFCQPSLLAIRI
jgi:predicted dehydrogenase